MADSPNNELENSTTAATLDDQPETKGPATLSTENEAQADVASKTEVQDITETDVEKFAVANLPADENSSPASVTAAAALDDQVRDVVGNVSGEEVLTETVTENVTAAATLDDLVREVVGNVSGEEVLTETVTENVTAASTLDDQVRDVVGNVSGEEVLTETVTENVTKCTEITKDAELLQENATAKETIKLKDANDAVVQDEESLLEAIEANEPMEVSEEHVNVEEKVVEQTAQLTEEMEVEVQENMSAEKTTEVSEAVKIIQDIEIQEETEKAHLEQEESVKDAEVTLKSTIEEAAEINLGMSVTKNAAEDVQESVSNETMEVGVERSIVSAEEVDEISSDAKEKVKDTVEKTEVAATTNIAEQIKSSAEPVTEVKQGIKDVAEEPEESLGATAAIANESMEVTKDIAVPENDSVEQAQACEAVAVTADIAEQDKAPEVNAVEKDVAEIVEESVKSPTVDNESKKVTKDIAEQKEATIPETAMEVTECAEEQKDEVNLKAASEISDEKETIKDVETQAKELGDFVLEIHELLGVTDVHKDTSDASDPNDSQESKLIIDEEEIENEAKDDEKDSCEDTSEVSVLTQVDVSELPADLKTARKTSADEIKPEKSKEAADVAEKVTEITTSMNVIEIEDDLDDEVEATSGKNAPKKLFGKQQLQNILQIIEIDDDDDEEPPPGSTSTDETPNTAQLETNNATTNDIGKQSTKITQNEDVEMMDISEKLKPVPMDIEKDIAEPVCIFPKPPEAQTPKADEISLKPTSTSPKPTEVTESVQEAEKLSTTVAASPEGDIDDAYDVFYNRECVNYMCPNKHKQYYRATLFVLNYFQVKKKPRQQYICAECYDMAVEAYELYGAVIAAKRPLYLEDFKTKLPQFVEIIDSSDEEEDEEDEKLKPLSKATRNLIEFELENSIKAVLAKVDIQKQLTWTKTILNTRLQRLESETEKATTELRALQRKADNMYNSLYTCPKVELRQLAPLDLNSNTAAVAKTFNQATEHEKYRVIPSGEVRRPPIIINETYYAVKNKAIASWVPCKVVEQVDVTVGVQKNVKQYRIKFLKSQYQLMKIVSAKHLAYYNPPTVRLPIGTRVIAWFDASSLSRNKEKVFVQSAFYPGIVAEPLKPNNNYRYLIFYDDGYTQYVKHQDVRLVCQVSDNVWEDVHPASRDFIQKYLTQYSINRPMVQTQKGQSMTTESNGKWIYARVVDIDCSLIQMQFEGPKSHTEWIYRGSLRLGPVFKEYQKSLQKDTLPISRVQRRTEPFIRYTEDEEPVNQQKQQQQQQLLQENRHVAKKSVSRPTASIQMTQQQQQQQQQGTGTTPTVRHLNNSTIYLEDENKPKGKVVYYTAKRQIPPSAYKEHKCSKSCLHKVTHNLSAYSPLSKPLLSGWERLICRQKNKKYIAYRGPCGRLLRDMSELHHYLRLTENVLNVDNFDFSPDTNCLAEYVIESAIVQRRDISNGQEKMVIPLVNYYDNTFPPECKYAAQRIPTEGVNINLDEDFFVGCDCEDDCSDKSKCSCWQLTYEGAKYGNPNTPLEEIGYQYKRLYEHVPTGIYECNPRCKCKSNCLNRVVQESLQMKLQVFKTSNRGWGLRCINDVPKGSFICVYAGHLLTEAKANEGGLDAGDEYFAELDYIEVAEQIKEGYEEEVIPPELLVEEDTFSPERDDDDEFQPSKSVTRSKTRALTRSSTRSSINDDDSQERQVINFNPNADMNEESGRESSIRKLFGKDEACYVMDAKVTGNLGRYFNHSCSPNLFVQNVFVDTHDLRFPWVAFFALTHIRAGTELTWNYNYEVGVVPGKVLYCQCGAPNCRLRLL